MSLLTTNLDGGQTDAALSLAHFAALFPNSGVLSSAALTVAAQGSPDMSVKVSGSLLADVALIKTTAGGGYFVQNTDDEDVTILANASGVTKTDAIVLYVDLLDGDLANAGSPGAAHLIAVRRAGVSTGAPTDGEIDAATSNNPWTKLAEVSVSNGASSITGGNITDIRLAAWFSTFFYGSNNIPGSAVTNSGIGTAQLKPTTSFPKGSTGGNLTTASTSYADLVTIDTVAAGTTNVRIYLDLQLQWFVSANAGLIKLTATGTGVTVQSGVAIRTASTVITPGMLHAVIDVTAGNTATIKLQGKIITSGTVTVQNNDATDGTWAAKLVAYGNA